MDQPKAMALSLKGRLGLLRQVATVPAWLMLAFISCSPGFASSLPDDHSHELSALMAEIASDDSPGFAVGVVIDNEIVFEHYRGLANLDVPSAIGPRSRFNIASNAKQFTALMALNLAQEGKIDLSEDFRSYLPGTLENIGPRISVAHLITHTSGIRDIYDLWAMTGVTWYERPFRNRDAMALLNRQSGLNFAPGTDYVYSNSNYILLAEVIAKVTGEAFHRYARAFFDRIGMTETSLRRRYGVVIPHLARAYGNWSGWLEDPALANLHGDGFLYTSLPDLLTWEKQVWGNDMILAQETIEASQVPLPGDVNPAYGFGLEFDSYRGMKSTFHQGSTGGANAYTLRFSETEMSIVVLANSNQVDVAGLSRKIADILLADRLTQSGAYPSGPERVGEIESIDEFLGLYELESGTFIRIARRDGEIYREIEGRDPVRLIPETGNVYRYAPPSELRVVFEKDDQGTPGFTLFLGSQAPQRAVSVSSEPADKDYLGQISGSYLNDETDTLIQLTLDEDGSLKLTRNGRDRTVNIVNKNYLTSNSYRIRIQPGSKHADTRLLVDNNRIRNVVFRRIE